MGKQLFTSDWHLGHNKIMEYEDRPYESIEEMEEVFFNNLDELWERGDTLYFLGDMSLNDKATISALDKLLKIGVRNVVYIFGNHDHSNTVRNAIAKHKIVSWCGDLKTIKLARASKIVSGMRFTDKVPAFLCHYPMRSWNMSAHGARHLHGHSHGDMPEMWNCLDVGIDNAFTLLGEHRPFTNEEVDRHIGYINVQNESQRSQVLQHRERS